MFSRFRSQQSKEKDQKMGVIKVHGAAMSTAAQRVFTCLYEKELNFEFVPVDMASGEHKKEAYLSLNVSNTWVIRYIEFN